MVLPLCTHLRYSGASARIDQLRKMNPSLAWDDVTQLLEIAQTSVCSMDSLAWIDSKCHARNTLRLAVELLNLRSRRLPDESLDSPHRRSHCVPLRFRRASGWRGGQYLSTGLPGDRRHVAGQAGHRLWRRRASDAHA